MVVKTVSQPLNPLPRLARLNSQKRLYSSSIDKIYRPAVVYSNADLDKLEILKENKGKSGVYL
jgi:hypothetical protein